MGAANDFGLEDAAGTSTFEPKGAFSDYLTGRFAEQQGDLDIAADRLRAALAQDAGVGEVANQAFVAAVLAGRPDAARLATGVADNAVAQLVLADRDAKNENWEQAEARFSALPQQGLTQILRPLLIAWAQQGARRTTAALAGLQPALEEPRFRGVLALHAALIADLGGFNARRRPAVRGRAGRVWRAEPPARADRRELAGPPGQRGGGASAPCDDMVSVNGDLALARDALERDVGNRQVRNATDGIAETYLAMAATLRQQNANDSAQVLLRLALDVREDFTAARLLLADIQEGNKQTAAAAQTLAGVPPTDPLAVVVTLRRANLLDGTGQEEEATRMLEALAQEYPDRPEPLVQIGDSLRRRNRFHEAAEPTTARWPASARPAGPTGRCSTSAPSPSSATTSGPRRRPISSTPCNWRRTSRTC